MFGCVLVEAHQCGVYLGLYVFDFFEYHAASLFGNDDHVVFRSVPSLCLKVFVASASHLVSVEHLHDSVIDCFDFEQSSARAHNVCPCRTGPSSESDVCGSTLWASESAVREVCPHEWFSAEPERVVQVVFCGAV